MTQATMFEHPNKVDINQELKIPEKPLEWKAQKLQVQIERMEKFAENNPQQFSSKDYVFLLNEFERIIGLVNDGATSDASGMDQDVSEQGTTETVGEGASSSSSSGVSADNPFSR